jgi:hypothetical protein
LAISLSYIPPPAGRVVTPADPSIHGRRPTCKTTTTGRLRRASRLGRDRWTDTRRGAQGVYGLVGHLGSLFVRIVLAPFEQSVFHFFSRGAGALPPQLRAATLGVLVKLASVGGCAPHDGCAGQAGKCGRVRTARWVCWSSWQVWAGAHRTMGVLVKLASVGGCAPHDGCAGQAGKCRRVRTARWVCWSSWQVWAGAHRTMGVLVKLASVGGCAPHDGCAGQAGKCRRVRTARWVCWSSWQVSAGAVAPGDAPYGGGEPLRGLSTERRCTSLRIVWRFRGGRSLTRPLRDSPADSLLQDRSLCVLGSRLSLCRVARRESLGFVHRVQGPFSVAPRQSGAISPL